MGSKMRTIYMTISRGHILAQNQQRTLFNAPATPAGCKKMAAWLYQARYTRDKWLFSSSVDNPTDHGARPIDVRTLLSLAWGVLVTQASPESMAKCPGSTRQKLAARRKVAEGVAKLLSLQFEEIHDAIIDKTKVQRTLVLTALKELIAELESRAKAGGGAHART